MSGAQTTSSSASVLALRYELPSVIAMSITSVNG
jgi:hypothetical protein